jgi:N6-L-threonylcarbamoyladenine synthase
VVANSRLRERILQEGERDGLRVLFPSMSLCTDNGAMIACAGYYRLRAGERTRLDAEADPGLPL